MAQLKIPARKAAFVRIEIFFFPCMATHFEYSTLPMALIILLFRASSLFFLLGLHSSYLQENVGVYRE